MDKRRVAQRLVKLARELVAIDPEAILKDLKYIQIKWAEGDTKAGLPTLEGKKFNSVRDAEKAINRFSKPDLGYDKVGIIIALKDGSELKNFRYDHGERDLPFTEQLEWYLENRVSLTGSRRSAKSASTIVSEDEPKKVTRATVRAILKKMGLKPEQYEMASGDVTFWPELLDDDFHKGIRLAEKYAKQFAAALGGRKDNVTISSNGSKYWVKWRGETIDMGDWNDPASKWHY